MASSLRTWPSGSLTYETFFGLKENPFSLSSDPRFLYQSRTHAVAFDDLLAGIRRREGLIVLTGDIGTGKTTLCRAALQTLDRKTFTAFVPDPFASREDLLKMLLIDFGVMSIHDLTTGPLRSASRTELSYLLYAFLETLAPLDAFVVVIIDEAQNMSLPMIEEVRILSDSSGRKSQLQVVFVGQLELHAKLKLPEMRQVDQRVSVHCRLDPLSRDAMIGYVRHRLHVAGGSPERVDLTPEAMDVLYRGSGGVPRLINRICDRALYLGYLKRTPILDREILELALDDVGRPEVQAAIGGISTALPVLTPAAPRAIEGATSTVSDRVVDAWVTQVEVAPDPKDVPKRDALDAFPQEADVVEQREPARVAPPTVNWRAEADKAIRRHTALHRVGQSSLRRIGLAALCVAALGGVVATALFLPGAMVSRQSAELPTLPVRPALAPAIALPSASDPASALSSGYVVGVALFKTQARADTLVDQLRQMGFGASQRPLDLGSSVMQQVLLGRYATRAEAEADLKRLQQTSGYEDARVAELPPGPALP